MKLLIFFILTYSTLFSKIYYSKVAPYEVRNISSKVSGEILFIDESMLGKELTSKPYITIDSQLDTQELSYIRTKLQSLQNTISVNQTILDNYKALLEKKRKNYQQIEHLKIKSRIEKDREFYDLINSENSYLNTQKEINNLKIQKQDLKLRKAQLEKSIQDKILQAKKFVLYSIEVKVGQVVTPATPLATLVDISKAILTIYLDKEDVSSIKEKSIYLENKKTDYKITRLLTISDTKNISKYKAQIIIQAPTLFSKLIKVEIK